MNPMKQRCAKCGQDWWDAHACPADMVNRNDRPQTVYGTDTLGADPARLTAAARIDFGSIKSVPFPATPARSSDPRDAEIDRLRAALRELAHASDALFRGTEEGPMYDQWDKAHQAATAMLDA